MATATKSKSSTVKTTDEVLPTVEEIAAMDKTQLRMAVTEENARVRRAKEAGQDAATIPTPVKDWVPWPTTPAP